MGKSDQEPIWCEVVQSSDNLDNKIKEMYSRARSKGYSKLEVKASIISWVEVLMYAAEIEEAIPLSDNIDED